MDRLTKKARDAFAFSRGGLTARSSLALIPAIAHDRINQALDEKLKASQEDQPETGQELNSFWGRFWLRARRRAA